MYVTEDTACSHLAEVKGIGSALASQRTMLLFEQRNRWGERSEDGYRLTMADVLEGLEEGSWAEAHTALLVENTRREFMTMSEDTRLLNIGSYEKWAFPIIRAVFPNLVANEIVSVQPMPGPTSIVFYMQFLYNKTKGKVKAGQSLEGNPNAYYGSELVDEEDVGPADAGATPNYTGNLSWLPVKKNSVIITDGTQVITDNGAGLLVGDVDGGGANTIDYESGAYDVDFAGPTTADVVVTYEYDNEGSAEIPEIDMNLAQSPITARTNKLRVKWPVEVAQDLKALHGMDAETEMVGGVGNEMKFEIDHEIIGDIRTGAGLTEPTIDQYDITPPTGISKFDHKLTFTDHFVRSSNQIHKALGGRGMGTFVLLGLEVANIVETLPGFKSEGDETKGRGVHRVGTLNGRWVIYKDTFLPDFEYTMGYRNTDQMFEVGYVWAPYIMAFTTPTVEMDDFKRRKGIASRYGKKFINANMYLNGKVVRT